MHICLVTAKIFAVRDGVGDYAFRLAVELAREHQVTIVTTTGMCEEGECQGVIFRPVVPNWRLQGLRVLVRELDRLRPDVVNLQYEPHFYHRWGINLWLPLAMLSLRCRGGRLLTTVHEPFVPLTNWKWWCTGPVQRLALGLLVCASRKVLVSIEAWARMLRRIFFWRKGDFVWVPVGSNIPTDPAPAGAREEIREAWGLPRNGILLGTFSPLGSGKRLDLLFQTWDLVARRWPSIFLLLIGVTREEVLSRTPEIPAEARVVFTGFLSAQDASRVLGCLDVFLIPYVDGVSTRRTAAIAAMAHGIPIVTTRGHLTDRSLFETSPIRLVSGDRVSAMVAAVEELVRSNRERERIGDLTRRFYEQHFAWGVIAKRVVELAEAATA